MSEKKLLRSERLRQQIEQLKQEADEAERVEREARRREILRAAARAGLDDLGLDADTLVREFRAIAARRAGEETSGEQRGEGGGHAE